MQLSEKGQLTKQLLAVCGSGPVRTATEIANGIEHAPATVSGILHRLAKAGRVRRFKAGTPGMRPDLRPGTWVY